MERENNNKALLLVVGAATLITAMVGATFAYFSATDTSETQTITTASSNMTVAAENNHVANIYPTSWTPGASMPLASDITTSNDQVIRIKVSVTGQSSSEGEYTLSMNQPLINMTASEPDQGAVADIKWAAYDSAGNRIVDKTSMTEEADTIDVKTTPFSRTDNTPFTDHYYVYVWIENSGASQNNLQGISFDLTFSATGRNTLSGS